MMRSIRFEPAFFFGCLAALSCSDAIAQQAKKPQDIALKLEVNVIRVLVPVVVRDKHGKVVTDLDKEDFQIFDNDKPSAISAFAVEKQGEPVTNLRSPTSPVALAPTSALPERSIVFLFDDLHMNAQDMAQAQKAATRVLAGALSSTDIAAVVSLSGKVNSGLTRDPAKLQSALMSLRSQSLYQTGSTDCPKIGYYQADLIENKHDTEAEGDAIRQVFNCNPGLDVKYNYNEAQSLAQATAQQVVSLGRQDIQTTYASIAEFVRKVSALPGQRMLVLVSPGFLPIEQEARTAESRVMDLAAQSNVTISALDARGIYTTEINASERSPGMSTILSGGGSLQLQTGYRRESMSVAENAMGELTDGTGGTFFHNSNDIEAGFKTLAEAPECVYVLELALNDVKPDGTYHRLKVKVDRDGLQLQARRGYFLTEAMSPPTELSVNPDAINLDIVVLDKKDKPVLDLKPEEVVITDGDSPVSLSSLRLLTEKDKTEHQITFLFDRPPPSSDPHHAPDPAEASELRDIATKILKMFPDTGFSFSVLEVAGRLQLQHGFTSDRKTLVDAISAAAQVAEQKAGVTPSLQEKELATVARTGSDASGTAVSTKDLERDRDLFTALSNSGRIVQDQHMQPALAGLLALAQSQRQIAARKAILYFTSIDGRQPDSRTAETIEFIIGAANRAGVTIYVVDRNHLDLRASKLESIGMSMANPSEEAPKGRATSADMNQSREAANSALQHLAEGTGGSYIVPDDDLSKPAKQMIQDLTTYYEASYLPANGNDDGKFRSLAVKPLRAGLRIRSQSGYLDMLMRAGVTLQRFELPLLRILNEPLYPTDLSFRSSVLHMEDLPDGSSNTLAIEVPLSSLDVLKDSSTNLYSAHASMMADIKDKTGEVVAHFSEDAPQRGALQDAEGSGFEAITLQRHFVAPPGQYVLEVAVLDRNSGKAGAHRLNFEIPNASGVPSLSNLVIVRRTTPFHAEEDPSEPLQYGSNKVTPNISGKLPVGSNNVSVFFIVRPDPSAHEDGTLNLQLMRDGKPLERAPVISGKVRKSKSSSFIAGLSVDPPRDGQYEVKATVTQDGKTAEARAPFIVSGTEPANKEATGPVVQSLEPTAASTTAVAPGTADSPASNSTIAYTGPQVITLPAIPIQSPQQDELKSILEAARQYALSYGQSLPNFVCEQVTNRSVDRNGTGKWKHKDKLTELLTYVEHEEARTLLVKEENGAKSHKDGGDTQGALSSGEFGGVLEGVFRLASKTDFQWKETAILGEATVQVFDYRVERANSILNVGAGTTLFVGCHGQVFIDAATRGVRRITMVADDLPNTERVRAASVNVDYDYIAINNHDYLLPIAAQITITLGHGSRESDLNEIKFRNFRRFGSNVRILNESSQLRPR
jgi:VWFA-related protein